MNVRGIVSPDPRPLPGRSAAPGPSPAVLGHGAQLMLGPTTRRAPAGWLSRWIDLCRLGRSGRRAARSRAPRYVVAVQVVAAGAAAATVTQAALSKQTPSVEQLATFATFLSLATVAMFARGPAGASFGPADTAVGHEHAYRDAFASWTLPVGLLLPPAYAAVMQLPLVLGGWLRLRPRRQILFDAATLTLAGVATATVHRALAPVQGSYEIDVLVGSAGPVAALFAAVAVFVVTSRVLDAGLSRLVDQLHDRHLAPGRLLGAREAVVVGAAETCSALVVAVLWTAHPLLLLTTTPPTLLLQRNLCHGELLHASRSDTKTGLANPSYWRDVAAAELLRTRRAAGLGAATGRPTSVRPTSVLLVDVDHFKLVNDTHGHLVGDVVLSRVADALRTATRPRDLVGRFGGEEFVVLLASTDLDDAAEVGERIRRQVAATACVVDGRPPIAVTVSVGVACDRAGAPLDVLLEDADTALYQAKAAGRDRVHTAPSR